MVDRLTLAPEAATPSSPEAPAVERPAWLPEEFKSPEDLVRSYQETKATYTRTAQELAALKKPAEPAAPEAPKPPAQEEPKAPEGALLEIKDEGKKDPDTGVPEAIIPAAELEPFKAEFVEKGDVSEESRKKLYDRLRPALGNLTEQLVNDYIEGAKVRRDTTVNELMSAAGGSDNYGKMVAWAAANFSDGEKEAYNRQVNSGDFNSARFAITALRERYEAKNGKAPSLITGANAPLSDSTAPFANVAEMTAAIKDPRYKKDPAYRKLVEQRVAKSTSF